MTGASAHNKKRIARKTSSPDLHWGGRACTAPEFMALHPSEGAWKSWSGMHKWMDVQVQREVKDFKVLNTGAEKAERRNRGGNEAEEKREQKGW